jgi:hypothetical protein
VVELVRDDLEATRAGLPGELEHVLDADRDAGELHLAIIRSYRPHGRPLRFPPAALCSLHD